MALGPLSSISSLLGDPLKGGLVIEDGGDTDAEAAEVD